MSLAELSLAEFEKAAVKNEKAAVDRLEQIHALAEKQIALEEELKELEEQLKALKKELDNVAQVDLPTAMGDITMFTLTNGASISIKEEVFASISKAKASKAHEWLEKEGHGDLIKRELKALLPREEAEKKDALREAFVTLGIGYEEKESIHVSTLKAFVKEQLEKGVDIPLDLFGIFKYERAKIVWPKKRKS